MKHETAMWILTLSTAVCLHLFVLGGFSVSEPPCCQLSQTAQQKPVKLNLRYQQSDRKSVKNRTATTLATQARKVPAPLSPGRSGRPGISSSAVERQFVTTTSTEEISDGPTGLGIREHSPRSANCGKILASRYTEAALDVSLRGIFKVDVLVDKLGSIHRVTRHRKIGYGMDELVDAQLLQYRCQAALDENGRPQSAWVSISVKLELQR